MSYITILDLIDLLETFPNKNIPIDFYDYDKNAQLHFNGLTYDGEDWHAIDATKCSFLLREKLPFDDE